MKLFTALLVMSSALNSYAATQTVEDSIKAKAASCTACHGAAGVSANPLWPNLAGQKAEYIMKQLRDFKAGRRQDPLMSPMAQTIADGDIEAVAHYFSKLTPTTP